MVLWEITLGTAYVLGLKRTYKLALNLQRRLISPKHQRLRQFAHRRTRGVFDIAVKVHKSIQEKDLEVGRNVGTWILRWLDRTKPSTHIHGPPTRSFTGMKTAGNIQASTSKESVRHLFASTKMSIPKIAMMMPRPMPFLTGIHTQLRHTYPASLLRSKGGFHFGMRKDIMQWLQM